MPLPLPAAILFALFLTAAPAAAWPIFRVTLDAEVTDSPQTGRLIIYLIREAADVDDGDDPADGPFWDDPQPMFGINVTNLAPGAHIDVQDGADYFPVPPSALPQATYRVQAVLDVRAMHSDWKREPGNFYSDPVEFLIGATDGPSLHELTLSNTVPKRHYPDIPGVEIFEVRSRLLSLFHGRDVYLRAGVVLPRNHEPERQYAAIYEIPGFGSDHEGAFEHSAARLMQQPGTPEAELARTAFWIVLDPESANGHTLFADSANNGPRGQALVQELIPALEARYNLIAQPHARLLRGHSSGGWSTIWLAITYPETFGAAWASAPDPVDFRRFQLVNIYEQDNFYFESGEEIPSYRDDGKVKMSIRDENRMEHILGPFATSGQQWASWQAVFGPRRKWGGPVSLYCPLTGEIDRDIAERYRAYDITQRIRDDNDIALIFRQRIRLVMGEEDNFYLEEAVRLLERELDQIQFIHFPEGEHGYIRMVPGRDHRTIKDDQTILAFPAEMLEHLDSEPRP
jgi:hypothetical protein